MKTKITVRSEFHNAETHVIATDGAIPRRQWNAAVRRVCNPGDCRCHIATPGFTITSLDADRLAVEAWEA